MIQETTMHNGTQALARVLEQLAGAARGIQAGQSAQEIADAIWSDFRTAVAVAQAETREAEVEGVKRWQQARHS